MNMPTQEDRATAIGNMHKKFGEDRTCSSEDMIADTHTDALITILRSPIGGGVTNSPRNDGKRLSYAAEVGRAAAVRKCHLRGAEEIRLYADTG